MFVFLKHEKENMVKEMFFLGLTVPQLRIVAKKYQEISLDEVKKLLVNKIYEYRLCALIILRFKYEKENIEKNKEKIVNFYLKNTKYINNWDLVDLSCRYILGNWLLNKNRQLLYQLTKSKSL